MRWVLLLLLIVVALPTMADPATAAGLRIDDNGRP